MKDNEEWSIITMSFGKNTGQSRILKASIVHVIITDAIITMFILLHKLRRECQRLNLEWNIEWKMYLFKLNHKYDADEEKAFCKLYNLFHTKDLYIK